MTISFRQILILISVIIFGLYVLGIRQNLPYTHESDESIFVTIAINIAASGDLNPHWFGNPGSTLIYLLAALFHIWHAMVHRGMFFHPDPNLRNTFSANPSEFYLLARLVTITYSVLSIPLVYMLSKQIFGRRVGLISAWLSALSPVVMIYARIVRTDSAGVFFGLISLVLYMRLYEQPSLKKQIFAGLATGLAIATRYFMITLVPILLVVDGLLLWRYRLSTLKIGRICLGIVAGLLAIGVGFILSTPFFLIDLETVVKDIRIEARSTHLGADGLSPAGNFWFYIAQAIPRGMTWPCAVLAAVGILLTIRQFRLKPMLLLSFVAIFLGGISLLPLHWDRWAIPALYVLFIFSAKAVHSIIEFVSLYFRLSRSTQTRLLTILTLLISIQPAWQLVLLSVQGATSSTRILAREWILNNLPPGSRIAQEWYTAPLSGTAYILFEQFSLAQNKTLEDYYREGYSYLIVSSAIYERYFAEPERYTAEVAFYHRLFDQGRLLREFRPSAIHGGPVIRIYELDCSEEK